MLLQIPTGVCVARGGTCVCVWPEPALLRGLELPIPALSTTSLSSAGLALLRALAVPRDLTGTTQSNRHYSTSTTEGPVLYTIPGMLFYQELDVFGAVPVRKKY